MVSTPQETPTRAIGNSPWTGPTTSGPVTSPIPITGVTVTIGGVDAPVLAAALVAPGQFQVNFTVPQIADGEYPITVSSSGKTSPSNVVFEVGQ